MFLCRSIDTGFGLRFDRLLEEIPTEIFEQWRVLYDAEPWGEDRIDFAFGTAIMHNAAAHRMETRSPMDYMHYLRKQKREKPQKEEDIQLAWNTICDGMERREKAAMKGDANV